VRDGLKITLISDLGAYEGTANIC